MGTMVSSGHHDSRTASCAAKLQTMKLIPFFLVTILIGCHRHLEPEPLPRSAEQEFSDQWVGKHEDAVLLRYGGPVETIPLSNGNKLIGYHQESTRSKSRSLLFRGSGGGRSDSRTVYCDRRFEIDKTSGRIVHAIIVGTACDDMQTDG